MNDVNGLDLGGGEVQGFSGGPEGSPGVDDRREDHRRCSNDGDRAGEERLRRGLFGGERRHEGRRAVASFE